MKKRHKKSVETGHARIPGEALREYATTNGGGYCGPGRPYEMLSDLYLCYQYYLVNKLTLTQGVRIFLSKVVVIVGIYVKKQLCFSFSGLSR